MKKYFVLNDGKLFEFENEEDTIEFIKECVVEDCKVFIGKTVNVEVSLSELS